MTFIDIVFDGPPDHDSGRFVEVEDAQGRSIRVGSWMDRGDGFWVLRLPDHRALTAAGSSAPPRCDCGAKLSQCADCAIGDYQAAHPDCPTCCKPPTAVVASALPHQPWCHVVTGHGGGLSENIIVQPTCNCTSKPSAPTSHEF